MIGLKFTSEIAMLLFTVLRASSATPTPPNAIEPRRNTNNVLYAWLWGDDGPSCDDVDQYDIGDCFLAATLCIVAERGKEWLMSAVRVQKVLKLVGPDVEHNEDNPPVVEAAFHLFKSSEDPGTQIDPDIESGTTLLYEQTHGTDEWIKFNFADDIRRENSDTATNRNYWWISGFQHAFADMFTDEYLEGGFSAHALNALTNRATVTVFNPNKEDKCEIHSDPQPRSNLYQVGLSYGTGSILKHARSGIVMLGTVSDPEELHRNHAYAVFDAWTDDNVRMVKLRNPWGPTDDYKFDDIADDVDTLYHFKNWDVLKPAEGLETPTPETQTFEQGPNYTPLPAPGGDLI